MKVNELLTYFVDLLSMLMRFSVNLHHFILILEIRFITAFMFCPCLEFWLASFRQFEPRREKTGLRGFRPGPTQTGLFSRRSRLEA